MPTTISTIAPVPRCEPLVARGFEADREEEFADESITDSVFETGRVEEVADRYTTDSGVLNIVIMAGEAINVGIDAKVDVTSVVEPADVEGVGPSRTPWLHVTALACGESSTLNNGPRNFWGLPSRAL